MMSLSGVRPNVQNGLEERLGRWVMMVPCFRISREYWKKVGGRPDHSGGL